MVASKRFRCSNFGQQMPMITVGFGSIAVASFADFDSSIDCMFILYSNASVYRRDRKGIYRCYSRCIPKGFTQCSVLHQAASIAFKSVGHYWQSSLSYGWPYTSVPLTLS
jgi:hypothetical protein